MTNPNPLTPEELAAIREQFEAWYATPENGATLHDEHQFERRPESAAEYPGEYANWEVDLAWRAWQAALEAGAWRGSDAELIRIYAEEVAATFPEKDRKAAFDAFNRAPALHLPTAQATLKAMRRAAALPSPPKDTQ